MCKNNIFKHVNNQVTSASRKQIGKSNGADTKRHDIKPLMASFHPHGKPPAILSI
jgi:hypothetical protein